jgi:hypothetical protein
MLGVSMKFFIHLSLMFIHSNRLRYGCGILWLLVLLSKGDEEIVEPIQALLRIWDYKSTMHSWFAIN